MDTNFFHLIGVPYSELDCWQLAREFYAQVFEVELKNYYESTPTELKDRRNLIFTNRGDFTEVTGIPKFGDLILLKVRGIESHIAVYVGNGSMLHTDATKGSHIDRLERWGKVIVGYYRLEETDT